MLIGGTSFLFALTVFKLCQAIEYNPKVEYDESTVDNWNRAAAKGLK
jgi:hypothetical protein